MKWIPLKIYQGDLLLKEIEYVCKIYNSIVQQFKNNKTEENRDKYINIRDEIKRRIFEINTFYSNNINDNRIGIFEQGKNILEDILKKQVQINNCIKSHKKQNVIKTKENLLNNEINKINQLNENKINLESISKEKMSFKKNLNELNQDDNIIMESYSPFLIDKIIPNSNSDWRDLYIKIEIDENDYYKYFNE